MKHGKDASKNSLHQSAATCDGSATAIWRDCGSGLLRRADLQLAFSQGFHPKPRISFPSALALGIEALDEIVELEVVGDFSLEQIAADIRREMPAGMELIEVVFSRLWTGQSSSCGCDLSCPHIGP